MVRFPDPDPVDPDGTVVDRFAEPTVDGARQHLAGRIDLLELRQIGEIFMVVPAEQFIDVPFEFLEVERDADPVEFRGADGHRHFVIVAVQIAAVTVVSAQLVRGGKSAGNFNFKHRIFTPCDTVVLLFPAGKGRST